VSGIAAPAPVIYVTVLGAGPDDVVVRDAGTDPDLVRVEVATVHIAGPLSVMRAMLDRAVEGVTDVELARRGELGGCSGYGADSEVDL
jgi:hypothetical protein